MLAPLAFFVVALNSSGAWPTLRGGPEHSGYVDAELKRPFRLAWAREFAGERLGTAMEPIVAGNKVFAATHSGNLYAIDASSGEPIWRFEASGAFLHSPAAANNVVVAASVDGRIYGLGIDSGKPLWSRFITRGRFSASPLIVQEIVIIGSRAGELVALNIKDGSIVWQSSVGAPIRQSAAFADGKVFVTA